MLKITLRIYIGSISGDADSPGCCALLLALVSVLCCLATLPLSLIFCVKVKSSFVLSVSLLFCFTL